MSKKGLEAWVTYLRRQNMPVLGDVIVDLNKITGSEDANVNQLAEVILRDPKLTSHVLRIANSVQYNYTKQQINTVSRAIVLIGLKGMRAICISLLVMDNLLNDEPVERLLQLIAQGFHAATQAKSLVSKYDEPAGEEVFIAALLYNLGEMAFWSNDKLSVRDPDLLSDQAKVRKDAMERVLGTSFKAITKELAKHWKLGHTLEQALYPPEKPDRKVKAVVIGERLSRAALYGWDSPQVKKVVEEVADYAEVDIDTALNLVKKGADESAEIALSYGVSEACSLIPSSLKNIEIAKSKPVSKVMKSDAQLQLSILRELTSATTENMDVNTILQMVVEGIHRGIGLERVAIAFISGHKLQAKYALGEGTDHWRSKFLFDVGPYSESVFTHVIQSGRTHWFNHDAIATSSHLYPDDVVRILGKMPSLMSVLEIDKRKVGVFYADRWTFGGKLDSDHYEAFKHFTNQALISLSILSSGRKEGL